MQEDEDSVDNVAHINPSRRGPKPSDKIGRTGAPGRAQRRIAPLMGYLAAEARHRNETPADLAKQLGIGYVYMTQLLCGKRSAANMGRDILVAAAKYLDVPVAEAYLWAGALEPTDFVHETKFNAMSGDIYDVMSRHPYWGGFMPAREEWDGMTSRARLFVTMAFEQATGIKILDEDVKTMIPSPGKPISLDDAQKPKKGDENG